MIASFSLWMFNFHDGVEIFAQSNSSDINNVTGLIDIQPNISAENIFNTKIMTLGNND